MKIKGNSSYSAFVILCMAICLIVMLPVYKVQAETKTEGDYEYVELTNGTVAIAKYKGKETVIAIPNTLGGKSVTAIVYGAFGDCTGLTSITIPDSVTSIRSLAFEGCNNLTSITIPSSVTSIEYGVFSGCNNLTSITVDKANTVYNDGNGSNAIIETASKTLIWGGNKTIIPNTVTRIGERAFYFCSTLTGITIPSSITSIGKYAFVGCSGLTSITIPSSVTVIGDDAFNGCSSLTSITVDKANTVYNDGNGSNAIIETASKTLIRGCNKTIIPNSVTSIGGSAFSGCSGLKSITIPDTVKSLGASAFNGCSDLTSITIPSSVTSIGNCAFMDCSGLTNIIIQNGLTSINYYTFCGCSSLTSITIPESVTSIDITAFNYCSSLTSITIPGSVTSIENGGEIRWPENAVMYVESGSYAEKWAKNHYIKNALIGSGGGTSDGKDNSKSENGASKAPAAKGSKLKVAKPACIVKVVSDDANAPTVEYVSTTDKSTTKLTIPDTVSVDGITYKVVGVAGKAVYGNKKIKSLTVGANITSIGANAFGKCAKLQSVNIKSPVLTKIGANAFNGDKKLTKITLKTTKLTKKSVGKNAFKGTNKKLVVKVPKSVVKAYKKYFKGKGNKKVKVKK